MRTNIVRANGRGATWLVDVDSVRLSTNAFVLSSLVSGGSEKAALLHGADLFVTIAANTAP